MILDCPRYDAFIDVIVVIHDSRTKIHVYVFGCYQDDRDGVVATRHVLPRCAPMRDPREARATERAC